MFPWNSKYRKIGPYGLSALLLITVAVILRVILISNQWPLVNSDEATMALHALHIINRGELPIFFYGQSYMGTIEAYLGACFFRIFGPSIFALRLGLVILYAGFLLTLYVLARLLYTKGVALAALFFLCLGSTDTLNRQLIAIGGYVETWLFGTLSLLLACWLVLSFHPDSSRAQPSEGIWRKRLVAYGCLGVVIGLGLWSDLLILPFVCTSLLLLLLFCRCELRTRACLVAILGFLVGSLPLLIFNIRYPLENSLSTLWDLHNSDATLRVSANLGLSLAGTIMISIPIATGANPLCPVSAATGQWIHQFSLSCMGFQACWGIGATVLWILAMAVVIRELQKQRQAFFASGSPTEKEHLVRCAGRLMLLASAGLVVLSYATSPTAALLPVTSSRYLIGLLVATPAIVAFLWPKSALRQCALTRLRTIWATLKITDIIKCCLLCFIGLILLIGTINTFDQISDGQKLSQRQDALIHGLLLLHAPHIYSDYWTCDRLIFLSSERIICSALDPDLHTGENRYELYAQIVRQDRHPAYVFDIKNGTGISQDKAFKHRFGAQYHRLYLAGYAVYLQGPTPPRRAQ